MKIVRRLAILGGIVAALGLSSGAQAAQAPKNCVGESVQRFHTTFMGVAQSERGAVGDMIASIRADPEAFPWCG